MADPAFRALREEIMASPAADRLKEELRNYLLARAAHTVTALGRRRLKNTLGRRHLKNSLKDKAKGALGKSPGSGQGTAKAVTISEDIDVGVPVREAYDQWPRFQEFSAFAKGVVSADEADDTSGDRTVKAAKPTRSWTAHITEQVPGERIAWSTQGAKGAVKGVVTFHALTDNLTRVLMVLEYVPKGLFEKTGTIWRAQGRRARLDLKAYRRFVMMRGAATDAWRGEIRDGEESEDATTISTRVN
ncbi:SRPBCC family protein [Streptomyces sp. NPDC001508]|uniref:SRPBCC family protein n=1 Tax=Streptomyces sp. NPDC001508 TaxID=3154656 RepID=UPI00331D3829